jgi:asparagine synthase (glutamine-hydrolysing)
LSAIHGLLRFDGRPVSAPEVERQSLALAHRGPNRRNLWRAGPVGIGHLLLPVTYEDAYDAQPLRGGDGALTLVADLRLDNREALAAELGLENIDRMADSALLLKAYERWGDDCVEHLIGDYAFALWDASVNELVLARDPMGQRHLHYHHGSGLFAFATETKGLWALADVPRDFDIAVLAQKRLARHFEPAGRTLYAGVLGLQGGTLMRVRANGTTKTRCFWEPRADPRHVGHHEAYYVKAYREILAEAVACRVRRAVQPAALFFSGGFDSGAIASLAGSALGANRKLICVSSVPVQDSPNSRVREWIALFRKRKPYLQVQEVTCEGMSVLDTLESGFLATSTPHSPTHHVNTALYAAAAKAGARVVMDGHGGDYTLNPRARGYLARRLLAGEWGAFWREFKAYRRHNRTSFARAVWSELVAPMAPFAVTDVLLSLVNGLPLGRLEPVTPAMIAAARRGGEAELNIRRANFMGEPAQLMVKILERQRRAPVIGGAVPAASHGLEFTQPFHDVRVIGLALAIPERLHMQGGLDRHLARRALVDILPPEYQTRLSVSDPLVPNSRQMIRAITPQLLAEIDRMARNPDLARYFDFDRMREYLLGETPERVSTHKGHPLGLAVHFFLAARFVEWQARDNRNQADSA